MDDIAERVRRLERQNRRWRAVGCVVLLVGGVAILSGMTTQEDRYDHETLRVKQLFADEIRVYRGPQTRLMLCTEEDGTASIRVQDDHGHPRVWLKSNSGQPAGLYLYDPDDTKRAELSAAPGRETRFAGFDATGIEQRIQRPRATDEPAVKLQEPAGTTGRPTATPAPARIAMGTLIVLTKEPKLWAYWKNGEDEFNAEFVTWAGAVGGVCRFETVPAGTITIMSQGNSHYPRGWPQVGSAEVRAGQATTVDLTSATPK